jgi:hypothetical protein
MLDGMRNDTQAYMRRIGREALRLSIWAPTALERAEARRLADEIIADLRYAREAAQA